jgi:hypothetical protein
VFWISKGILMTFCSLTFEWEWLLIILLRFLKLFLVIYDGKFLDFWVICIFMAVLGLGGCGELLFFSRLAQRAFLNSF